MRGYALDNSAIIHLAALDKHHANSYRFTVKLTENVKSDVLQEALFNITKRFPTILAGIKADHVSYRVNPVNVVPKVMKDTKFLATMSKKEIEKHAFRVLYKEKEVSIELFHAITDGYGAIMMLKSLLAEYMWLEKGVKIKPDAMLLDKNDAPTQEEVSDDYFTYAGGGKVVETEKFSYQMPLVVSEKHEIKGTSYTYKAEELLGISRYYGVSLTTLLSTILLMCIVEIQKMKSKDGKCRKPVQIMVPMNLRKLFPSKSLRNFILCAFPSIRPLDSQRSFEELLPMVEKQLKAQFGKEHMKGLMTKYTNMEKKSILKIIPLAIKVFGVRLGHYYLGEKKSCITLTNLGRVQFPEGMENMVEKMEVYLTPRRHSLYNCGIISYGDKISINFSRLCEEALLDTIFQESLEKIMTNCLKEVKKQ